MKKILCIEDEPAVQKALSSALTPEGYEVFSALNGLDGMNMVRKEMPDLILLDLVMPGKDGFAVLGELKQDSATARIPVIIMSNLEASEDVDRALALGATTYLVKMNYKLDEIVGKIKSMIGDSHAD